MKFTQRSILLLGLSLSSAFRHSRAFVGVPSAIAIPRLLQVYPPGAAPQHRFVSASLSLNAKPKRGSVVDSYQTVSVNCAKCTERLFRYKKKNGTKSNLIKCYVERISEDSAGLLEAQKISGIDFEEFQWACPKCESRFARHGLIHGRPALKMVGGKIRMTKK